ncbi:hypothetical protein ABAC460_17170 [Asticcacaulis sp. AC460]|nr:hypothetical protein ABAC460_17170 [Asticcacaulis sp. AC460]
MGNFQRDGSISNSHVGRAFELRAQQALLREGVAVEMNHKVPCGLGNVRKNHAFDLGSDNPKIIVECKSQTWTVSGNIPSAKMKNWAEAMFYFQQTTTKSSWWSGACVQARSSHSWRIFVELRRT